MWRRVWRWVKPCFLPASPTEQRPRANEPAGRYVRSFLFLRLTIGLLGFVLPLALLFIDWRVLSGNPVPRDSLSAYYYSGMRELFTVSIGTIAFFLFTYKITEKNLDNTFSIIAGLAGMVIPLCPTSRSNELHQKPPKPHLTPIQHLLGESWTQGIHFGASLVFIVFLGLVCVMFARREAKRPDHGNKIPQRFWMFWHLGCAFAIAVAGLWILATIHLTGPFIHGPYWSLLLGEWIATWAFALSWFAKGAELKYLFGFDQPTQPGTEAASA